MALTENNLRTLALAMIHHHGQNVARQDVFDEFAADMCDDTFGLGHTLDEDDRACLFDLISRATVTLPAYMDPRV